MKKKLKVAHIQLLPLLSGVQNVTLSEVTMLDKNKFESTVICKENGPLTEQLQHEGIKYLFCRSLVRNISPLNDIKAFIQLYRIFKHERFDIVHTHSSKTGLIGRLAAKFAGVDMIVHTVHGFAFPSAGNYLVKCLYKFLEFLGAKCSDKIICLHNTDYNICVEHLRANKSTLEIIPNGIDTIRYNISSLECKNNIKLNLEIPVDAIVVGMVGRLWVQKNPQMLLDAALEVLKSNRNIYFVFVGDGDLRASLELKVPNEFKEQFLFLGWRNDTNEILKSFDIFVLPSLWEGMPLAILEALSTGLPCIVSDIPGNHHLIKNNENGFLFELSDLKGLTTLLWKLIDNDELRFNLGRNARKQVECHYSIVNRINTVEGMYLSFFNKGNQQ